jgi:hypothetical protein
MRSPKYAWHSALQLYGASMSRTVGRAKLEVLTALDELSLAVRHRLAIPILQVNIDTFYSRSFLMHKCRARILRTVIYSVPRTVTFSYVLCHGCKAATKSNARQISLSKISVDSIIFQCHRYELDGQHTCKGDAPSGLSSADAQNMLLSIATPMHGPEAFIAV